MSNFITTTPRTIYVQKTHPDPGSSPGTFPSGPDVCPEGELWAWDVPSQSCFNIVGLGIAINDLVTSDMGAMNVFNINVHRDGKQPPIGTALALRALGPVSV